MQKVVYLVSAGAVATLFVLAVWLSIPACKCNRMNIRLQWVLGTRTPMLLISWCAPRGWRREEALIILTFLQTQALFMLHFPCSNCLAKWSGTLIPLRQEIQLGVVQQKTIQYMHHLARVGSRKLLNHLPLFSAVLQKVVYVFGAITVILLGLYGGWILTYL